MYSILKALLVLALLGFFSGISTSFLTAILCASFFLIPAGVLFFILCSREEKEKQANEKKAKIRLQQEETEQQYYNKYVFPVIQSYYNSKCIEMCKPDSTLRVNLFPFDSEAWILQLQADYPNSWWLKGDPFYCWCSGGSLHLLQTFDSVESIIKRNISCYDNSEKICNVVKYYNIPLDNIHYYKVKGEVIHSTRVIEPASSTYSGASVNGISFGEVKTTPEIVIPHIVNTQYIVLYYRAEEFAELQTIFFDSDALDTLIRVIPQFEK